jgi:hypothetical protein
VKKGRHRRFEEARKLKQVGPDFLLDDPALRPHEDDQPEKEEDDEYAEIAARYGAFDEDEDDDEEDADRG